MDGFSYHNIFETKGIEYLAIICFFLVLIPFWVLLNRQRKVTKQLQKTLGVLSASILRIPQGILYSKNHTWAHLEKSGAARIGMDDLLLHLTGEVNLKNLRKPGDIVQKGDPLAELDQYGRQLEILSPISGEILDNNQILQESPELLNEDPFGKGWIYKIKPSNWLVETKDFLMAEDATAWTTNELDRFKDFLAVSMKKYSTEPGMLILQDGGEITDNPLVEMPKEAWADFEKDFLKIS
ncbi:MAG: glycine cleavage system protein H [Bacteroidota bacterium]